jgi:two-component system, sensor histidine kinase YesM
MNFKFQTKIMISFSLLMMTVIATFLVFFNVYVSRSFEAMITENLIQLSIKVSQHVDSYIGEMDQAAKNFVTNSTVLNILSEIARKGFSGNEYDKLLYSRRLDEVITKALAVTSIPSSYVYVYDRRSLYAYAYNRRASNFGAIMAREDNRETLENRGKVLYARNEYRAGYSGPGSLSLVRSVFDLNGEHFGYVEILEEFSELVRICDIGPTGDVEIVDPSGGVFFPERRPAKAAPESLPANRGNEEAGVFTAKDGDLYSYAKSDYTGLTVLIKCRPQTVLAPLRLVRNAAFATILAVTLFTLLMIYLISGFLVHPIRTLRDGVVKVSLENMELDFGSIHTNDEVVLLNEAFKDMLARLKSSMEREIALNREEEKARFAALQAQMAPHFIHNVLYIISILAHEKRNDDVERTCKELSNMLRYVVTPASKPATMADEVGYASDYLSLQKRNYEDFLEYSVAMDERIAAVPLPRLVIQPFVENSIHNGFKDKKPPWRIRVACSLEGGDWTISIEDNGCGIGEGELAELRSRLEKAGQPDAPNEPERNSGIGGIGIVNTYARLSLMYKGGLRFDIGKNGEGGTTIGIRGPVGTGSSIAE